MAEFTPRGVVHLDSQMRLTEAEMRALVAITDFGDDTFIKALYPIMGKAYVTPHEKALRVFFADVRTKLPPILERATTARSTLFSGDNNG